MRRLLLHGPAIRASRIKLQEFKEKFTPDNIIVFEEKSDFGQILTNLQSQSLFDSDRLIILENPPEDLFSNFPPSVLSLTLILWFDHKVDPKKWLGSSAGRQGFEELFFPEQREVSVFPFLDFLAAKDIKAFLEMEKLKIGGFDVHYFLTMAFYLLRNLAAVPKKAPQFVKDKLRRQRKNFPEEKIIGLYEELLEIDFKLKSGLLEKSQAEFLLVNKFTN